eukprot:TRINITY_DN1575_c3_g1_i1.p2 TRINITY_DN1575_c3_g1~~TRINITY_DN1575_c3_g1_i1.p2  ORF type:complete len:284 (-),score=36.52 TRINITY_DN1575_c3_g1_i1:343-1194(-)
MSLSEEQAAVYDRQIRLWGSSVQTRLNQAHVFIQGQGGLFAEVAKNLALAGVGQITINITGNDRNYLCEWSTRKEELDPTLETVNTIKQLNPFIKVQGHKEDQVDSYSEFDFVVFVNEPIVNMEKFQQREGCKFVFCGCWGGCGYMLSDLKDLNYEHPKQGRLLLVLLEFQRQTGRHIVTPDDLEILRGIAEQKYPNELQSIMPYLMIGTCQQGIQNNNNNNAALDSIMGGLLANGVIKQLGGQADDERIEFVVYDPFDQVGWVQPVKKEIGRRKLKVRRENL